MSVDIFSVKKSSSMVTNGNSKTLENSTCNFHCFILFSFQ